MLRRIIILLLSIAALATAGLIVASYSRHDEPDWNSIAESDPTYPNWRAAEGVYTRGWTGSTTLCQRATRISLWNDNRLYVAVSRGTVSIAMVRPRGTVVPMLEMRVWGPVATFTGDASEMLTSGWPEFHLPICGADRVDNVRFPLVLPLLLLTAYPCAAVLLGPVRRSRRVACGYCPGCAYDLRAVLENRCPECGRVFDPVVRREAMARREAAFERAAIWVRWYRHSLGRRAAAVVALVAVAICVLAWPASYRPPRVQTPWFTCRVACGNLFCFGNTGEIEGEGQPIRRGFEAGIDGYRSMSVRWWPWPFVREDCDGILIPFWVGALFFLGAWCAAYRPVRHLRAREVHRGAAQCGHRSRGVRLVIAPADRAVYHQFMPRSS